VICDGEVSSSAQVVGGGGQCQRADGGSGAQWYARYQAQRTGGCGGDAGEFDGDGGDGADGPTATAGPTAEKLDANALPAWVPACVPVSVAVVVSSPSVPENMP
jgi:hypothetical protein